MVSISSSGCQSAGGVRETATAIGFRIQSNATAVGSAESLHDASILMIPCGVEAETRKDESTTIPAVGNESGASKQHI